MPIAMTYKYGLRAVTVSTSTFLTASAASLPAAPDKATPDISKIIAEVGKSYIPTTLPLVEKEVNLSYHPKQVVASLKESPVELRSQFSRLAMYWKVGRNPTGTASRMTAHPAYRAIIRLGPDVIPFVLEELRRDPDEWFYALAKLSGENPVPDACRGRFRPMVDAWLRWGKRNGYLVG